MAKRYRILLKWVLYSLGFLVVMILSTVVLGNRTFFGTKLSLVPVYVCCVACREGHESGGFFALGCGLVWALSGITGGPAFVLLLPVSAIVAGFFCTAWLTQSLLPTMAFCLLSLVLCEGGVYVLWLFLGEPLPSNALELLGIQVLLSMLPAPVCWGAVRLMGKVGA